MRQVFRFTETRLDGREQGSLRRELGYFTRATADVGADAVYLTGEDDEFYDKAVIRIENILLEHTIKYIVTNH